jgi:hypothetical protein
MQAFVCLIQLCVFLPLGVCLLLLFLLSFRKFLGKEKRSAVIRLVSGYSLKKVSLSLISGILLPLILAFVLSLALDYPIALLFTALFKGMGVYGSVSSARLALSGFFLFLGILLLLGIYSIAELWKTRKRCFLRLPAEEYWLPEFDADLDGEGFSRVADKHLSLVLPDDSLYGKKTDAFFFSVPLRRKNLSVLLQTVSVIVVLKDQEEEVSSYLSPEFDLPLFFWNPQRGFDSILHAVSDQDHEIAIVDGATIRDIDFIVDLDSFGFSHSVIMGKDGIYGRI